MTTRYIADTGVFIRAGGPTNHKYRRLRNAVRRADASLLIPRGVFNELSGDSSVREYPSGRMLWQDGIDEGWIVVAEELDYLRIFTSTNGFAGLESDIGLPSVVSGIRPVPKFDPMNCQYLYITVE